MKDNRYQLLDAAKKAYYEGNPIMGDEEYDALERELGLENASETGYHSDNYTVKHPFMMGSLSKIQVKEDDGKDWDDYLSEIKKYVKTITEYTPKFDGVSFELIVGTDGTLKSVSTRGDGTWGKNIYCHVKDAADGFCRKVAGQYGGNRNLVIRGEVLVRFADFDKSLAESYANTRAFVAGSLNQDKPQRTDNLLAMVAYDFRDEDGNHLAPQFFKPYEYKDKFLVEVPRYVYLNYGDDFRMLYDSMEKLRESCEFPLDGFVIKTEASARSTDFEQRPKDCVAIKFKPAVVETEIEGIEWNYSPKTAEYFPVGVIKPVILDSKTVTRVSLHNFGYVFENKLAPGAKVRVSMAGDIIPFLYEVLEPSAATIVTPIHTYVDGVHLYRILTGDEKRKAKFLASCDVLGIKGLGPALAETLYEFQQPDHILLFDFGRFASERPGKTSANIRDSFAAFLRDMSLAQLIESLAIPFCGERMSKECAAQLSGGSGDFSSMAAAGYSWVFNAWDTEHQRYLNIRKHLETLYGKTFDAPVRSHEGIKVVLTGSPKEFGYKTKADFLAAHPELVEVSNLKDADMLVTDDLSSTSSKMQKAAKLGKQIKTYAL